MHTQNASLVMESRGLAPNVRSFHFTDLWSRLYKTDDYFLDITCKPDGEHTQLSGQVMLNSGLEVTERAQIVLYHHNQAVAEADIDDYGQFRIDIDQHGIFDLEVNFPEAKITVPQLSIQ
jgi:hypothetical protein